MNRKPVMKYKASGPLILTGGLNTLQQAKCYHGLLVLAQLAGWKYDERGVMRVSMWQLDKLTGGTCKTWKDYRDTLTEVMKGVHLDWGHLSAMSRGRFNRSGVTPILSEVYVNLDLAGEPVEVVFRIPADLMEDVIKPSWFGQVNPAILFRLKSNYAFHAYLFASLTVIERDKSKQVFWSKAHTLEEWRDILGVEEGKYPQPFRMRAAVFKRVEEQIDKRTRDTEEPLSIAFEETPAGLYQMRVKRLPVRKVEMPKKGTQRKAAEAESERLDLEREKAMAAEERDLREAIAKHPRAPEILEAFNGHALTWFNWQWEISEKLGMQDWDLSD